MEGSYQSAPLSTSEPSERFVRLVNNKSIVRSRSILMNIDEDVDDNSNSESQSPPPPPLPSSPLLSTSTETRSSPIVDIIGTKPKSLSMPPTTKYVPAILESPQALESSLKNSHDFNMPSTVLNDDTSLSLPRSLSCPVESSSSYSDRPSSFCSMGWNLPASMPPPSSSSMDTPGVTSSSSTFTLSVNFSNENSSGCSSNVVTQEKEKLITKRKLSISEYRQRKGTSLSTPLLTSISSSLSSSNPSSSPLLSHNTIDLDDTPEKDLSLDFTLGPVPDVSRVIEKSVLMDQLVGNWSKSADKLRLRDPIESPSNNNNNNQTKPPPKKADPFLERPKENLTERLNREFNIRLSEAPPLPPLQQPPPPIPEILPPTEVKFTPTDQDLESYIPTFLRTRASAMPK